MRDGLCDARPPMVRYPRNAAYPLNPSCAVARRAAEKNAYVRCTTRDKFGIQRYIQSYKCRVARQIATLFERVA
jgi:hypothetical protein